LQRGTQHWAPLTEFQAGLLLPQLQILASESLTRHQAAFELKDQLQAWNVPLPCADHAADVIPGYYKFGFRFRPGAWGLSREQFCAAIRAEGVAIDPGYTILTAGRSASRYRALGELPGCHSASAETVALHHPILLSPTETRLCVAQAIRRTYLMAREIADSSPRPRPS
ncbi:MAG: DegT/DnrJ/EryC1/StrS family aminotransferase, partial [Gemmataceae bacterium]